MEEGEDNPGGAGGCGLAGGSNIGLQQVPQGQTHKTKLPCVGHGEPAEKIPQPQAQTRIAPREVSDNAVNGKLSCECVGVCSCLVS